MKDGAIVCNSGHFDVEIDLVALKKIASSSRMAVRPNVDEYTVSVNPATSTSKTSRIEKIRLSS
jgi:adenosylhomocysteinase